jgi:hypothetical protein
VAGQYHPNYRTFQEKPDVASHPPTSCSKGVAAGVAQRVGVEALSSRPAPAAARSILWASPAVVNGEPRSLTKTKGENGLSRWSRRRKRPAIISQ